MGCLTFSVKLGPWQRHLSSLLPSCTEPLLQTSGSKHRTNTCMMSKSHKINQRTHTRPDQTFTHGNMLVFFCIKVLACHNTFSRKLRNIVWKGFSQLYLSSSRFRHHFQICFLSYLTWHICVFACLTFILFLWSVAQTEVNISHAAFHQSTRQRQNTKQEIWKSV